MPPLKIATFNINGVRSRLPALLAWLEREQPDIACLQELKAPDAAFPIDEVRAAGYGAIWQGQTSWNGVAILARGMEPLESRRGLPGDPDDSHSRYIEAVAHGVIVGCLYLPNGNPQPGPKFDYKLAWFERLIRHAQGLHDSGHPVVLAGDYNVVPTDFDIYDPKSWRKDALLQPGSRECYARLLAQGWTDSLRTLYPDERIYTFWDYFRQHWPRNSGLRIDHLLLSPGLAPCLREAGVDRWVRDLPKASDHAPTWIRLDLEKLRAPAVKKAPAVEKAAAVEKAPAGKKAHVGKKTPRGKKASLGNQVSLGKKAPAGKRAPAGKKAAAATEVAPGTSAASGNKAAAGSKAAVAKEAVAARKRAPAGPPAAKRPTKP